MDHSRIALRFSIITITTIFQMVLLLRSPEGMQHTGRLHLTVMTCPTIMSFITFRLMPLIPSCKLIIIHPIFGLSTWIAVVASYICMITPITFGWNAVVASYIDMITSITFGWIAVVASYIYMITSITFGWIAVVASYIYMITSITFGWIAVVASYIYMITSITFAGPSGFPVCTVATPFWLAKPHLCQVPSWFPDSCHIIRASKATSLLGFITWHSCIVTIRS